MKGLVREHLEHNGYFGTLKAIDKTDGSLKNGDDDWVEVKENENN